MTERICMENKIKIRGARTHNLKNIDVDIPKDKLIVFTGVSGSGKSSLAYDTIYAEGQRKYVESLSTYARQFLGIMNKPDVDVIEGLSPAISIDQKTVSHNPRSTVGTVTEIYDYMRLLFARVGHPHCPICGREISSQSVDQIVEAVINLIKEKLEGDTPLRFWVLSPVVKDRKGEFISLFENIKSKGYKRIRIDGHVKDINEDFVLIKQNKHSIEAVVDRLSITKQDFKDEVAMTTFKNRLAEATRLALNLSDGEVYMSIVKDPSFEMPDKPKTMEDHLFSERFACPVDNISLPEIEPRTFSFNSPHGACEECSGIGKILRVKKNLILAPQISILEGGIIPFATIFEHDTWLARLIRTVCAENNIDPHVPIKDLSKEHLDIILEGTGKREYTVYGKNRQGNETSIIENYQGVIKELEDRHNHSDSDYVKSGIEKYMREETCEACEGRRLNSQALNITIKDQSISEACDLPILRLVKWVRDLEEDDTALNEREREIADLVLKEIKTRLSFLENVGLSYLTLSRAAHTLSGGEAQRIRLASQIGSGLTGVLYVLDEPTIGLHPKDNDLLISTLKNMRDIGNTVIVVEHDKDVIKNADIVYDFGPGAGKHGGTLVAKGTPQEILNDKNSLTGKYLAGKRDIHFQKELFEEERGSLMLVGARGNNLKDITIRFPLGKFLSVTGMSGSGKSTLIVDTLYHAVAKEVNRRHREEPAEFDGLEGVDNVDKIIMIDQSPIGRTPRSNPATYTKVFDAMRDVYANTREAKAFGFNKGHFSFNVKGGRCEVCEGQGKIKIEMQFMSDIWVDCDVCHGARYNAQTLEVTYKGKNIADVLKMTVEEALEFFHVYKKITDKLQTLKDVGLGYIELGQAATTLSGGEAQRVKLATELAKRSTGNTLYILDEPTTGLHFSDLEKLVGVLRILVSRGNSVIVIEHNLDVIKNSDWVIDLGPDGGDFGGKVIAEGTPKDLMQADTYTAEYLREDAK